MDTAGELHLSSPPTPPPRPPLVRLCRRLLRLPPPVVRRLAIRLAPEILRTRQARIIGRIAAGRDDCDQFTPSRATSSRETQQSCTRTIYPQYTRSEAMLLDRAAEAAKRDLAMARSRLAATRADLAALEPALAAARGANFEPVSYAIEKMPEARASGGTPPHVVYVPGVVRAYVSPAGRLIDVLM